MTLYVCVVGINWVPLAIGAVFSIVVLCAACLGFILGKSMRETGQKSGIQWQVAGGLMLQVSAIAGFILAGILLIAGVVLCFYT